jgi:hypothetical protein
VCPHRNLQSGAGTDADMLTARRAGRGTRRAR